MDFIQGVGGALVPHKRPFGRRPLLPYELDLCDQLGVTPDEYWQFLFDAQEYVATRSREYDLIPDVKNGTTAAVTTALINLAIGIALTAASALLAPKPKSQNSKRRGPLEIEGRQGRTRYNKSSEFDSVQQLAQLGQTIQLVFANRRKIGDDTYGGIRVETDLLHSQLVSNGNGQLLYALMSLGMTTLGQKPDYDGLAIGDLLLRDFSGYKNRTFFKKDLEKRATERLNDGDVYDRSKLWEGDQDGAYLLQRYEYAPDVFRVWLAAPTNQTKDLWVPYFSGARTPSTAVTFGAYKPLPNGHRFYLPMELVLAQKAIPPGAESDRRNASKMKRRKLATAWPRMAGITDVRPNPKNKFLHSGKIVTYTVYNKNRDPAWFKEDFVKEQNISIPPKWDDKFKPWGLDDVRSIQDETRTIADEQLQENQMYLIGSSLAMLIQRDEPGIFQPEKKSNREYKFKIEEGFGDKLDIPLAIGDKTGPDKADYLTLPDKKYGGDFPWLRATVQQCAVGSITNSRPCNITEIGIKSEVWRRMTGSINFNAMPSKELIEEYEDDIASITVGTVNAYMRRYSFFRLYVREVGIKYQNTDDAFEWFDLTDESYGAFAVLGSSPVAKYNTIQIQHPDLKSYEYRFVPVPGSEFYADNRPGVLLLDARPLVDRKCYSYKKDTPVGTFKVAFTGTPSGIEPDNLEWFINTSTLPDGFGEAGPILELKDYETDEPVPTTREYKAPKTKYDKNTYFVKLDGEDGLEKRTFMWNGQIESLDAIFVNKTTIESYSNSEKKLFEYSEGKIMEEGQIGKWVGANDGDPMYDLGDDKTDPSGYQECVWYDRTTNKYNYVWNGKVKVKTEEDTDGYVKNENETQRYKRIGGVIENNQWEDDINNIDNFAMNGFGIKNGAVEQEDGICVFYMNNNELGRGTPSNPRIYKISEEKRWVAKTARVVADFLTDENLGSLDAVAGVKISQGVTAGVVDKDGKWLFYWDGVKQGETIQGRPGSTQLVLPQGTMQFTLVNAGNGKKVGPDGTINCYPIQVKQYALREITKQNKGNVPPTWQIKRQDKQEAKPQFAQIIRRQILDKEVQPEVVENVPIRYKPTEEGEDANTSARATVKYWPNAEGGPGKASWRITNPGDDYRVEQKVFIGVGHYYDPPGEKNTKLKTEVTGLVGTDVSDDNSPGYFGLITVDPEVGYNNYFPNNAICDYYINDTDTSSHADSPEHSICFVNEIIEQQGEDVPHYENLTTLGIKITNSKEWTSFGNVSAYLTKGIKIECLEEPPQSSDRFAASNLFPNIAYALLTDSRIGAGNAVGAASVNEEAMTIASKFCLANTFFWDGVIADAVNLRDFIFENAGYILCDFTIKGGQFALLPSVPYNSAFEIDRQAQPEIKALFTDGVVRKTEVTFLTPEERQPFQAVVLFREETKNGWPETRTLRVRFADEADIIPTEEFDMSGFCTSVNQARMFARVALKLRREVDHGIKFETTPQAAMGMEPGEYFKFASKVTHTERFASGVIDDKGNVISSEGILGSFRIVYWRPGTVGVTEATLQVSSDYTTTQTDLFGVVWSKVSETESTRVYKCESLSYSDDGLVEVTGSFAPLTKNGSLEILNWGDNTWYEELI